MEHVKDRFLRYVKIDTTAKHGVESYPSTEHQKDLGRIIVEELQLLGVFDAHMDEYGYVYGTIPSNIDKEVPVVGFIAHLDTSPEYSGKNVKASVIENYDGGKIILNIEKEIVLDPGEFPDMLLFIGKDLIVTDGTTLLGADDKAGVAEIMAMTEYLIKHPEIKHGTIKLGFTLDEEVGRGVEFFDVEKFGADFAYTVDGD
ncbi:MAG: tripeptide aminopeptidase PepT, partial [Clostridia bacterium]|nr:tripeptide aminopeptidase PepT [Clostridia bacterium]